MSSTVYESDRLSSEYIEELKSKENTDLEDEEVLDLLEYEFDKRDEDLRYKDLRENKGSSISYSQIDSRFGCLSNALWLIGKKPSKNTSNNGDTDIIEYELRGMEHELGRAPISEEIQDEEIVNAYLHYFDSHDEALIEAGIALPVRSRGKSGGVLEPEKENYLFEKLFIEEENPPMLVFGNDATPVEISGVIDAYMPWIDEESAE